jgi:hypothetical protein
MSAAVEEIIARLEKLTPEETSALEQALTARAQPGAESLLLTKQIKPTLGQRAVRLTRRSLWILLFAVLLIGAALVLVYYRRTETLARGTRRDQFQAAVSYKVERYSYRNRVRLIFADDQDAQVVCDLMPLEVDKIVEQRWLASGRALYLDLLLKSPQAIGADGQPEAKPAKIIYDYQRGELYVTSPLHLWRTAASEGRWMNEEEFGGVLARYN